VPVEKAKLRRNFCFRDVEERANARHAASRRRSARLVYRKTVAQIRAVRSKRARYAAVASICDAVRTRDRDNSREKRRNKTHACAPREIETQDRARPDYAIMN